MLKKLRLRREEALGPKHTSILGTVNNLGALYTDWGKLALPYVCLYISFFGAFEA
jgi:hypothetical protein